MGTVPATPRPLADVIDYSVPILDIVDIGAMLEDGRDRYDALVAQNLARVTGFEPNRTEFDRLAQRSGPYRYFPVFLGDGGTATFHLTHYPGCSSLLEPDPAIIDLFETMGAWEGWNFHVVKTEHVRTTRLDDLRGEIRADYIKIDVQGAELMVLRNGRSVLTDALVVETEAEFVPLYRGQPLFGDLQVFLRDQGFLLHKLVDVGGRPMRPVRPANLCAPISQVMWADAIFVRDFSRLDVYGDDGLIKAAAILHTVYQSFDLVGLLLREHDRRRGGALWDRYDAWLRTCDLPSAAVTFITHMTATA